MSYRAVRRIAAAAAEATAQAWIGPWSQRWRACREARSPRSMASCGGVIVCVDQFLDTVSHRLTVVASIGASMFANPESLMHRANDLGHRRTLNSGKHAANRGTPKN
jgi:hypothetical protein